MRLGFDLLFLRPRASGGREAYALALLHELLAQSPDLDVTAFVPRAAAVDLRGELPSEVRVVAVPSSAAHAGRWALGELAQLPVAATRAGVDLLHSPANFAPVAGSFARVVTLHDLQHLALPELISPARRIATHALLRAAAQRADRIITGSDAARREIVRELPTIADRIETIPHGVVPPAPLGRLSEDAARRALGLAQRQVVLAVSTDLPHKNLEGLVDAFSLIAAADRPLLVIAGARTDGPHLRDAAAALGIERDVRLLGFVSLEQRDALYRMAAGVVVPSLYEGFGLPALEAMSYGAPLACSAIPPLREVVGDAALRFPPGDAAAMATAIRELIGDPAGAAQRVRRGRERAARFTWRATASATLEAYARALRQRRDAGDG